MRLFVLDIDGTLTNSDVFHQQCFFKALLDSGVTEVDPNWGEYTHHTDSWIFAEIFRRNFSRDPHAGERAAFAARLAHYFDATLDRATFAEIAGARAFYDRLCTTPRTAFAFATGSLRAPALTKLGLVGMLVPPELLVTGSEFETREDIVQHAVLAAREYFGVAEFEQVISVGDGYWDLTTARNLGLDFIGIGIGAKADKLRAAGARVFPDLLDAAIRERFFSG